MKACPIVRIDFEQAYAIGHFGKTPDATRQKCWGDGPHVLSLEPEDELFTDRIKRLTIALTPITENHVGQEIIYRFDERFSLAYLQNAYEASAPGQFD